ncbi:hypothetical protein L484_019999 [Morus notabilis]|uniref:Uncharacterized protein n=1 Tax=Morus notabilis TaxID=981085 RepID=W9SBN4_9ROSA|nr:hypothetical protein L484_019999 [Morus notabilis]
MVKLETKVRQMEMSDGAVLGWKRQWNANLLYGSLENSLLTQRNVLRFKKEPVLSLVNDWVVESDVISNVNSPESL